MRDFCKPLSKDKLKGFDEYINTPIVEHIYNCQGDLYIYEKGKIKKIIRKKNENNSRS